MEDQNDGSYHIKITLIKIVAVIKVIVNMDKNIPAAGGELQPIQLQFVKPEGEEEPAPVAKELIRPTQLDSNKKLRKAGQEVMDMLAVGKDEGMKEKSAIVMAAEAFEEAGTKAKQKRDAKTGSPEKQLKRSGTTVMSSSLGSQSGKSSMGSDL